MKKNTKVKEKKKAKKAVKASTIRDLPDKSRGERRRKSAEKRLLRRRIPLKQTWGDRFGINQPGCFQSQFERRAF